MGCLQIHYAAINASASSAASKGDVDITIDVRPNSATFLGALTVLKSGKSDMKRTGPRDIDRARAFGEAGIDHVEAPGRLHVDAIHWADNRNTISGDGNVRWKQG